MIDYAKLGGLLATQRKKRGLSQEQLGRLAERLTGEPLPKARISCLENGKQYPGGGRQPEYRASVAYYLQYLYPFFLDDTPQALAILLQECWTMGKE